MNRYMKSVSRAWQGVAVALGSAAMVVVMGCGDNSGLGQRYPVTGNVTYKGAPLPRGTINFAPTKEEGRAASGEIKDGHYSLSTTGGGDGALPGDYRVSMTSFDIDMSTAVSKTEARATVHQGDAAYQKAVTSRKSLIPTKYNIADTSELKRTVGTKSETFDFDLKD
jgi:hypothetical protein